MPPSLERDPREPASASAAREPPASAAREPASSALESASAERGPTSAARKPASAAREPALADQAFEARRLAEHGVVRLRADNAGPLTLSGTNTWIIGRDPAYVIDPGPALEPHLRALLALIDARGGLGGIALTHDHGDHSESVAALRALRPAPLAGGRGEVDLKLLDGVRFGPLLALATPGHAPDHFALIHGHVAFTGDAVLGEGSVFIAPDPGALAGYLEGLSRLRDHTLGEDAPGGQALEQRVTGEGAPGERASGQDAPGEDLLEILCPGHGPPIWQAREKLDEYIAHRLQRERLLLEGLAEGARSTSELLDFAWSDVPPELRPVAAVSLRAHLDKLEHEHRLPADVERPS